eukprot:1916379-Pyramimonas_sp.AAC.1
MLRVERSSNSFGSTVDRTSDASRGPICPVDEASVTPPLERRKSCREALTIVVIKICDLKQF